MFQSWLVKIYIHYRCNIISRELMPSKLSTAFEIIGIQFPDQIVFQIPVMECILYINWGSSVEIAIYVDWSLFASAATMNPWFLYLTSFFISATKF